MSAAFQGRWVLRGGIRVPVTDEPKPVGRPPGPVTYTWDRERLLAAHRGYGRGNRDPWTREGERLYNASRKQAQRVPERMTPEDRRWAEQAAARGARRLWELENRKDTPDAEVLERLAPTLRNC